MQSTAIIVNLYLVEKKRKHRAMRRGCYFLLQQASGAAHAHLPASCMPCSCPATTQLVPSTSSSSCSVASGCQTPSQHLPLQLQQHRLLWSGMFPQQHRPAPFLHAWQHQDSPMPVFARALFIQTQSTPNPNSLMFLPGKTLLDSGSRLFTNTDVAKASPLASTLMSLNGVTSVLIGTDFITVTKASDDINWAELKSDIQAAITDHFASGQPLLVEGDAGGDKEESAEHSTTIQEGDSDIVAAIKELLESRIRPAVQEDGGDILFKGFDPETGVVTVRMMGSCSGCPSSTVTLKSGVENMLMHYVPEVTAVEEEVTEAETESAKALARLEASLGEKRP